MQIKEETRYFISKNLFSIFHKNIAYFEGVR